MGTNSNPRQQLREAIEANAEALADMRHAENTLARAHEMLGALMAKRADFDSLDSEIATARANLVKQALESEGNEHLLTEEPSGFAAAKIARENLDLKIAGVRDSIKVLEEELNAAREHTDECSVAIEHAAEAVIAEQAEQMAISFMTKLEDLRREQYVLAALINRWIPRARSENAVGIHGEPVRGVRQVKMPAVVGEAASQPIVGDSERKGGIFIRNAMMEAVARYWQNLKDDANAMLDDGATPRVDRLHSFDSAVFNEDESRL
jgi:chromosome segregation ATPase